MTVEPEVLAENLSAVTTQQNQQEQQQQNQEQDQHPQQLTSQKVKSPSKKAMENTPADQQMLASPPKDTPPSMSPSKTRSPSPRKSSPTKQLQKTDHASPARSSPRKQGSQPLEPMDEDAKSSTPAPPPSKENAVSQEEEGASDTTAPSAKTTEEAGNHETSKKSVSSYSQTPSKKSRAGRPSSGRGRKSKVSNPVAPPAESYSPGDYVWVRMKGYPTWPGKVLEESQVPERVSRPGTLRGQRYPVLFFGTYDYGFHSAEEMYPMDEYWDKFFDAAKKKDFVKAVAEAKDNRSILDSLITKSLQDEDEAMETMEENQLAESDDAGESKKKKRGRKRRVTDEGEQVAETTPMKKRKSSTKDTTAAEEQEGKRSKKSTKSQATGERKSKRHSNVAEKEEKSQEVQAPQDSKIKRSKSPHDVLLGYRHRLQKWLAKKKDAAGNYVAAEDEIEWEKVFETLENVENFNADATSLKETKILKVIKVILSTSYSDVIEKQLGQYKIREKCRVVMDKYSPLLLAESEGRSKDSQNHVKDEGSVAETDNVDSNRSTPVIPSGDA